MDKKRFADRHNVDNEVEVAASDGVVKREYPDQPVLRRVGSNSSELREVLNKAVKPKPLPVHEMKLISPYEVTITSAKGTFTRKIETQHDVDILMILLGPMNLKELPFQMSE